MLDPTDRCADHPRAPWLPEGQMGYDFRRNVDSRQPR